MTDLEFALISILSKEGPVFAGAEISYSAQSELIGQHLVYSGLFRKIESALSTGNTLRRDDIFNLLESDIKKYFEGRNYKSIKVSSDSETTSNRIVSAFPIINQEDIDLLENLLLSEKADGNSNALRNFRWLLIYGLRTEVIIRWGEANVILPGFASNPISAYDAKYISLREIYFEGEKSNSVMASKSSSYRSSLVEATTRFELFNDEFSKKTDALHEDVVKIENNHKDTRKQYDELLADIQSKSIDFNEIIEKTKYSIDHYENSINQYMKTSILGKFWLTRARWATASLVFSVFLIGLLVGGACFAVFYFSDDVKHLISLKDLTVSEIAILRDNVSGVVAIQLTRAFLLAVPVVLYFWIVKLAVRFFMRSLLLMDDARQRNTIMQSYVQMVRDGAVDEKALAIIMWALCRSVPGHGPDGIEPPDFTEVLRAGSSLGRNNV